MFYSIAGLNPRQDLGGYGFSIKLFPQFKEMVAISDINQDRAERALDSLGRDWLDICGYSAIFDPYNCGFERDPNKRPGPRSRHSFNPNQQLRVTWGEWGPEHITVPGNACGLDLDSRAIGSPRGGKVLSPHNVDNWSQVNLLLITFCWFAETMSLDWELRKREIK